MSNEVLFDGWCGEPIAWAQSVSPSLDMSGLSMDGWQ
jgi:hypothetical protein